MSTPLPTPATSGVASKSHRMHRMVVVVAWAAILIGYQAWAFATDTRPTDTAVELVDFLQGSAWGPVLLSVAYLVRPLLLFSAALLTVAAGFLFGVLAGLVVVIVASNLSAMVAYAIGRWFGGGGVASATRHPRLAASVERMRARSFETTMTLRLVFLPYDLVSYAAGLWRIHPMGFLAGTALGSIPGTVAFVLFGASIEEFDGGLPSINPTVVAVGLGMLVVSLVLARLVRRREQAT